MQEPKAMRQGRRPESKSMDTWGSNRLYGPISGLGALVVVHMVKVVSIIIIVIIPIIIINHEGG